MRLAATFIALGSALAGAATSFNMTVGGTSRNMLIYAPSGLPAKAPMIVQLHGMNQDAAYQQAQAKWEPIADTAKFLVVFPNGLNKSWDISGTTDVNFISAIIDTMVRKYGIDRNRVYLSGFSMGGMFTYHAMNKMSDKIAAFGPCSGYPMGGVTITGTRPVPIIHIHGTADDVVAYSGVAAALQKWRNFDGCPATAQTTKPYPKAGSVTTRDHWGPCTKNGATTEVVLLSNEGKGHWYSMDVASELSSVEIWNFSKKYSLGTTDVRERTSAGAPISAKIASGWLDVTAGQPLREVRVLDIRGTSVFQWNPGSREVSHVSVPFEPARRGVYFLEARDRDRTTTLRLVAP